MSEMKQNRNIKDYQRKTKTKKLRKGMKETQDTNEITTKQIENHTDRNKESK